VPCYFPLEGFRDPNGGISFSRHKSTGLVMRLPCGRCIGCRLERSRQWALRCMHEASQHEDSCFVTLTYSDEFLPENGSLCLRDMTLWLKRLRKSGRFRYFYCAEYGETRLRPHYHALLFGRDFPDRVSGPPSKSGEPQWLSDQLDASWKLGDCYLGNVTFESAAYVARYVTKKVTGSRAAEHYQRVVPQTGELVQVSPEFACMSRRPGIGRGWIQKYSEEVFPSDEVIARGKPSKPPRYYDSYLDSTRPDVAEVVRTTRRKRRNRANETPRRLQVRAVCTEARLNLFRREV